MSTMIVALRFPSAYSSRVKQGADIVGYLLEAHHSVQARTGPSAPTTEHRSVGAHAHVEGAYRFTPGEGLI